ncbi:MAG: hypothetical protein RR696_15035, partial [Clostridia bacterium]
IGRMAFLMLTILVNECKDTHRRNKRWPIPPNEAMTATEVAPEMFVDIGLQYIRCPKIKSMERN